MNHTLSPDAWGLRVKQSGELALGNHGLTGLAGEFGTPLHVINEKRLMNNAAGFREAAAGTYPGHASVYYAMKCNSVPAVVDAVLRMGPGLEVMTEYELALALKLGCPPADIIVNGPCKTLQFLSACVSARVRLVIVDSLQELRMLDSVARACGSPQDVLFRVNPDFTPRGMNSGTATGSRRGCAFGLDLKSGEISEALVQCAGLTGVRFRGYHMHIGTGIRHPDDYARALRCLGLLKEIAAGQGERIELLDVGGGFASATTREMGSREFLLYQAFGRLPEQTPHGACGTSDAVLRCFAAEELPELLFEPGRCIASNAQFLLLTVHHVKDRPGAGRWLIADGGLSTVTLPTFYEYHEVLLCNDACRPRTSRATIIGPACFAGDVIYKNKPMPEVHPGEVIAVMDSGAYFTAMESSFGFPHPAILAVNGATCKLVRTRETFDEMTGRDVFD